MKTELLASIKKATMPVGSGDWLGSLRDQLRVQGENGNWNCNEYMLGMFNGLECALATLEHREPQYRRKPDSGWLDDLISPGFVPTVCDGPNEPSPHMRAADMTSELPASMARPSLCAAPGSVLPCPFCGGEAKIFTRDVHDTTPEPRRKLYWYVCSTYGCGVGVTHGEWNEPRAREKWNRRVPPNESGQAQRPEAPSGHERNEQ